MRIAHEQPVVAGFVTGGVLAASAAGLSLAAPAIQPAELALTAAAASGTAQQCEPLQAATPTPSPTSTTPSPTSTTTTPAPSTSGTSPTVSASTEASTSDPATPKPSGSVSGSTSTRPSPSPGPSTSAPAKVTSAATANQAGTPTASSTPSPAATTASGSPAASTSSPAPAGQVSLCVAVQPSQSSIQRGQAALWTVTAWAAGGNVADATIRLKAAPASLTPAFSFGCGSHDGSTSCALGALDASSARRQLQAKVTIPASATTVTSVRLTTVASAANLPKDPQASAATTVTAAVASSSPANTSAPVTTTFPLSVGSLPDLPSASPALSPGGNAAGLFPSLTPSADPAPGKARTQKATGQTVANTALRPLGAPVFGAQLAGLGVLALAFVLAVARLSIRRRPAPAQTGGAPAAGPPEPATEPLPAPGTPAQQQTAEPAGDDAPEA